MNATKANLNMNTPAPTTDLLVDERSFSEIPTEDLAALLQVWMIGQALLEGPPYYIPVSFEEFVARGGEFQVRDPKPIVPMNGGDVRTPAPRARRLASTKDRRQRRPKTNEFGVRLDLVREAVLARAPGQYELAQIMSGHWGRIPKRGHSRYGTIFKAIAQMGGIRGVRWVREKANGHQLYEVADRFAAESQ